MYILLLALYVPSTGFGDAAQKSLGCLGTLFVWKNGVARAGSLIPLLKVCFAQGRGGSIQKSDGLVFPHM